MFEALNDIFPNLFGGSAELSMTTLIKNVLEKVLDIVNIELILDGSQIDFSQLFGKSGMSLFEMIPISQ